MLNLIRSVPSFPKEGVSFKDMFPLLQSNFKEVIDALANCIPDPDQFTCVAGIESRGFILASALAYKWNKGFVPIRKKGKLPPPTITSQITLEYGSDEIEMAYGKGNLLIVDDILGTGGTMYGAVRLAREAGYKVDTAMTLIDLKYLQKNSNGENLRVYSLFDFYE